MAKATASTNGVRTTVLVADDDKSTRILLAHHLEKAGFQVLLASNGREAIEMLSDAITVALFDLNMPEVGGIECLQYARKKYADAESIIITASTEVAHAVQAMKSGAFDYLTKPVNVDELVALVRRTARTAQLKRENRQLRQAIGLPKSPTTFIGESPAIQKILSMVEKIAPLDSTVLITGESGVGKGVLARMIHYAGPRAQAPFVTVSCTAMPRDLVEAELFGHEKGAFTGAHERRPGRVEMAEGGTLFLDEVGDMPLDLQPKLLHFLQDRAFQRIGSNSTVDVDTRVIAATHQNLEALCRDRQFREDLYFRLNVLRINIPPLRERPDDITRLADHVLARIAQRRAVDALELAPEALEALVSYPWPGNVRELENVLERTTVFATDQTITLEELPPAVRGEQGPAVPPAAGGPSGHKLGGMSLEDVERIAIGETLELCNGNKAEAARRLGISKKGIYNKMKHLGLS
ncbi:MAG: sigma-54-dependent transcriptional regulator [Acidobacteriota bacterium]